jgi:hypothetical protein
MLTSDLLIRESIAYIRSLGPAQSVALVQYMTSPNPLQRFVLIVRMFLKQSSRENLVKACMEVQYILIRL